MMKHLNIKFVLLYILLCMGTIGSAASQTMRITGRVVDSDGNPLTGATVIVSTPKAPVGAITDAKGNYAIEVPTESTQITFSYVGKQTQELFISHRTVINVVMEEDSQMVIDEVVVVGYGEAKMKDLTGAISQLNSDNYSITQPVTIDQALKGRVAGLQVVQSDGTPGGAVSIKIRGTNSINAGTAPLYVIDGFPMPYTNDVAFNPLTNIAPSAIESITVLKDASSTAIYGAQGANGVVLIQTKKARTGMNDLDVKISTGVGTIARRMEMLSVENYMQNYMYSQYTNEHSDLYEEYTTQAWKQPSRITDWVSACTQPSVNQSVDVSYLGSISNKVRNNTTFSYNDDKGTVINTGYTRYYFLSNTDIIVNKRLSFNTIISYENGERYGATWADNVFNDMLTFCPFVPKEWTWEEMDNYFTYTQGTDNPYRRLTDNHYSRKNSNLYGSAYVKYNILQDLVFSSGYSFSKQDAKTKQYKDVTLKSAAQNKGEASYENSEWNNWRYVAQLDYSLHKNDHHLNLTGAFESSRQEYELYSKSYTNYAYDLGWYGIYAAESGDHVRAPGIGYTEKTMVSGLARLNYNYKNTYYLTATMRADASSRFSPDNRWGYFPSVAASWRISELDVFKNGAINRYVNDLKLRVSLGRVGNDQIADYQYAQYISAFNQKYNATNTGSLTDGLYNSDSTAAVNGYQLASMANSKVKWEVSTEFNVGLDANLLGNRVIVSFDAYSKRTDDMLLTEYIPLTSGFETVTKNMGSIRNRGVELAVTFVPVQTKDWNYDINVTYSANRSTVLDLGSRDMVLWGRAVGNSASENVLIKEGMPLGIYFGNILNGIANSNISNANALPSYYSSVNRNWTYNSSADLYAKEIVAGKYMFEDLDGDGYTDTTDRYPIAFTEPAFIGGMTHTLRYKLLSLSANFSWSYGNDIINGNVYSLINAGYGINNKLASVANNQWSAFNPNGTYTSNGNYRSISNSELVEDGSFFRMNSLSLSVQCPEKWAHGLSIKNLALTYSIRNVFCLTRYSGYDPEVNSGSAGDNRMLGGVDYSSYPTTRTHTFALNIKF